MRAVWVAGAGAEDGAGAYLQDAGQGARVHAVWGAGAGAEDGAGAYLQDSG